MARAWFSSLVARWRAGRDESGAQERRVRVLLRSGAAETRLLAELSAELAGPDPIEPRTIELVAAHLRGPLGESIERTGADLEAHLDFWTQLTARTDSPLARTCRADLLLMAGDRVAALSEFLDAVEEDPALVHLGERLEELAGDSDGEARLRYRLACLRAALAGERPGDASEADDDDDYVRELYCEILEEHRGQPDALVRIRAVGALLDEAVDRGDLPRAFVRRAPRD